MPGKIETILLFFPVFLFSLSFHEAAHAYMAHRLGDDTAKRLGRMTLNPIPHIDPIGTILFPLLMFMMPGLILFGWAKPVPVNLFNIANRRRGNLLVSLAGPVSNLILAAIFAIIIHTIVILSSGGTTAVILYKMLSMGVYLNLILAFFNLIPIHPLDGSGIMEGLLPQKYLHTYHKIGRYGFLILIIALYTGALRVLLAPVYGIASILLPS